MKTKRLKLALFSLVFVSASCALHGQSSSVEKFFEKYEDEESFSVIHFSGNLFGKFNKDNGKKKGELRSVHLLSAKHQKNLIRKQDIATLKRSLAGGKYEELGHIRDGKEKIITYGKANGDYFSEIVVVVESEDNFVLVDLEGKLFGDFDVKGDLDIDW